MIAAKPTTPDLASARTCWVVSDGTKGMEVQSLGLARQMQLEIRYIRLQPPGLLRRLPRLALLPGWPPPEEINQAAEGGWPDLVITTGHRMAGLSILIRRLSRGRTRSVHIQDPGLPPAFFDYLIVPSHDHARGENVMVTTGSLNSLTPEVIATAGVSLSPDLGLLPRPVLAVMTGGSNRRYGINRQDYLDLGRCMAIMAKTRGASLVFIPSRRSLAEAGDAIREGVQHYDDRIPHHIWDGTEPNPYPGILGLADAIIVTSDSVNMTSEACLAGKPVFTYAFRKETGRIARFHEIMQQEGYTFPVATMPDKNTAFVKGRILDETARIADILRGRKTNDKKNPV